MAGEKELGRKGDKSKTIRTRIIKIGSAFGSGLVAGWFLPYAFTLAVPYGIWSMFSEDMNDYPALASVCGALLGMLIFKVFGKTVVHQTVYGFFQAFDPRGASFESTPEVQENMGRSLR